MRLRADPFQQEVERSTMEAHEFAIRRQMQRRRAARPTY